MIARVSIIFFHRTVKLTFIERREYFRIKVGCDIQYRLAGGEEIYPAHCTTLSVTGISFITAHRLALQDALEISIESALSVTPPILAYSRVVRVVERDDQQFEVGAIIKRIEEL